MCTDLEAVVEGVLYRNIGENTSTDDDEVQAASSSRPWSAGERIKGGNSGTCVAQVLDWTVIHRRRGGRARTAVSEEARAVEGRTPAARDGRASETAPPRTTTTTTSHRA